MRPDLGNAMAMARTIWKGALSFGLVNVPVGLYPATQDKTIHFNQFESGTADRIRYKKVNERTGNEVEGDKIVKGVDLGGGEYVILSDEELATAEPERSRLIGITDFVDLDEIDPVFFRTTYYLAPEGEAANKAYALLRQVMRNANKVAIGTLVMRNKEYPVAIRPDDEVLKLETMYFADEIRSPSKELPELPEGVDLADREIDMAQLLLESMESEWDPNRYHDTHRQKVEALIEDKRQGNEIVEGTPVQPAKVVDLMEALSASIKSAKSNQAKVSGDDPVVEPTAPARRTSRARSAPVKKVAKATKIGGSKKPVAKTPARRKAS
jgi:DNA end-binding protein Ku